MTDKLKELLAHCKCAISIEINEHRNDYRTAKDAIQEAEDAGWMRDVSPDIRAAMILADQIVSIQFYPDTPIGFYVVWHHDIDAALDEALSVFKDATPTLQPE